MPTRPKMAGRRRICTILTQGETHGFSRTAEGSRDDKTGPADACRNRAVRHLHTAAERGSLPFRPEI
jgi:hypothetical protein